MVLGVGVLVLVMLAVVLLVGARGRIDPSHRSSLARRTARRDPGPWRPVLQHPPVASRSEVVRAKPTEVVPWVPPTEERIGVTRRRFLNRSVVTLLGVSSGALGGSLLAFLWPTARGGFGSKVHVSRAEIEPGISHGHGFYYVPEGRMWITEYPATAVSKAKNIYPAAVLTGMDAGYVFLYQKCPHLGCRVPSCVTSQWFECPCHGSKYNRVGEKKAGPAPRGMDRFPVVAQGDGFEIDTAHVILGPPIGTNTTGQEAEGPHCVGGGAKA